jgi:hypothetical protein
MSKTLFGLNILVIAESYPKVIILADSKPLISESHNGQNDSDGICVQVSVGLPANP